MNARPLLIDADFVAASLATPLANGAVLIMNGTICEVGSTSDLRARHPRARRLSFPGCAVLPGLVNAHAHLELTHLIRQPPPASFVDWLLQVMSSPLADLKQTLELAIAQCYRFGVTSVGDISRHCHQTRVLLAQQKLNVTSFGEVTAMAQRRSLLAEKLDAAADEALARTSLHIGISPHAPYSIEPDGYRACLARAQRDHLPLTTHLAETREEAVFLASHEGDFMRLWQALGAWDDSVPRFAGGPIRYARDLGLLDYPTLLAHVNYCDDEELSILASGRSSVIYCPRTHAYFGHPPHRWQGMLALGINVAVGTDSTASSPDLNLVDDLRLLRKIAPEVAPDRLWSMATRNGATALGREDVGVIAAGCRADLAIFPIDGNDPLAYILDNPVLPITTFINGKIPI